MIMSSISTLFRGGFANKNLKDIKTFFTGILYRYVAVRGLPHLSQFVLGISRKVFLNDRMTKSVLKIDYQLFRKMSENCCFWHCLKPKTCVFDGVHIISLDETGDIFDISIKTKNISYGAVWKSGKIIGCCKTFGRESGRIYSLSNNILWNLVWTLKSVIIWNLAN